MELAEDYCFLSKNSVDIIVHVLFVILGETLTTEIQIHLLPFALSYSDLMQVLLLSEVKCMAMHSKMKPSCPSTE